jgi:hypothetical protein
MYIYTLYKDAFSPFIYFKQKQSQFQTNKCGTKLRLAAELNTNAAYSVDCDKG